MHSAPRHFCPTIRKVLSAIALFKLDDVRVRVAEVSRLTQNVSERIDGESDEFSLW